LVLFLVPVVLIVVNIIACTPVQLAADQAGRIYMECLGGCPDKMPLDKMPQTMSWDKMPQDKMPLDKMPPDKMLPDSSTKQGSYIL